MLRATYMVNKSGAVFANYYDEWYLVAHILDKCLEEIIDEHEAELACEELERLALA